MKSRLRHLLLSAALLTSIAQARRPDFLVLVSDDHGVLDCTAYGATDVRTPYFQRLADEGLVFDRAFVASPACAPSRAALLTGLMPARNGAEANHTYRKPGIPSLIATFRKLGYESAAFGKIAHGKDVETHGFDHISPSIRAADVEAYLSRRTKDRPLLLMIGSHDPHVPWPENDFHYDPAKVTLPPSFVDTPETRLFRTRYYSDVSRADRDLCEARNTAMKHLDPANTLELYTSDHGAQWPFGKWNLYDAGIRVPLIVKFPGHTKPGTRSDAMVSWIDLLPTLIDVAGGEVPDGLDGRSFARVLDERATAHRDRIFTTHTGDGGKNIYPIRSVRTDRFKYIRNLFPESIHTTHIDGAKGKDGLIVYKSWIKKGLKDPASMARVRAYHQRPAEELYDLRADPFELHNLAADPKHSATLESLRKELDDWMKSQHDSGKAHRKTKPVPDKAPWLPS